MQSLSYRGYTKANFNVGLFVGLLVSFIKSVLYYCYFCCTQDSLIKHFFSFGIWEHLLVIELELKT